MVSLIRFLLCPIVSIHPDKLTEWCPFYFNNKLCSSLLQFFQTSWWFHLYHHTCLKLYSILKNIKSCLSNSISKKDYEELQSCRLWRNLGGTSLIHNMDMVSFKEDYKTTWLTLHTICIVRAPATYQPWFCRWDLMWWDYGVSAMRSISALVRRTRHRMGSVIQGVSAIVISIFLIRMTALFTKGDLRSHQDWPLGSLDYQGRPQKTVLIRVMA